MGTSFVSMQLTEGRAGAKEARRRSVKDLARESRASVNSPRGPRRHLRK